MPESDATSAPVVPLTAHVVIQPNGRQADVPLGANLLDAARRMGVEIESICGGRQTCGKCRVLVRDGEFAKFCVRSAQDHLSAPSEREARYAARADFAPHARLSCGGAVLGDLVIEVPPESQTRKQVVRKGPGIERVVAVDAAMRLYYVEIPPAELKDHRGDWERLAHALSLVHGIEPRAADIHVLRDLQGVLAAGNRAVTATVLGGHEVIRVQPGLVDTLYGISLDVGTTTLAGQLCNLRTGEILTTASRMNPQVPFGEDLMSRVSFTLMQEDGAQQLHAVLIDGINGLIVEACAQAGVMPTDVVEMVIVGNTTMHHLLLGISPRELGGAPFSLAVHGALDVKARDLGLRIWPGANVHIPPCEAGHVGADNVAVLVAEAPYEQSEQVLILDVGTNGEILLGNRDGVLSASSPTGPAFEGAQILHGMRAADGAIERVRIDPATLAVEYMVIGRAEWVSSPNPGESAPENDAAATSASAVEGEETRQPERRSMAARMMAYQAQQLRPAGICGSGIIEAVAELFLAGVLAPNGRLVESAHPRLLRGRDGRLQFVLAWGHETVSGEPITVHAEDIRAIQLAKAALYAGSKLLMTRLGISQVARVSLAGGFGSYIDPKHAMILGMFPECGLDSVRAIGNAAGDGARMILLDKRKREAAVRAARETLYVESAVEPAFQAEFVAALAFPHARDAFPRVQGWLEAAQAQWPAVRHAQWAGTAQSAGERTDAAARIQRRAARAQRGQSAPI
ncbi:MAG: ASKHA domain-containing protein [Litorilinea sp.]